jgi:UDP-glucose 4-epimerase
MNLGNKTIMVIGGAGFIGSHLVEALIREGAGEVLALDNFFIGKRNNLPEGVLVYQQDATDLKGLESIFKDRLIDLVFNLAVVPLPHSLEYPQQNFQINTDIVSNLCELLRRKCFRRLIHFSSSEVYGSKTREIQMDEDHPLGPSTPYAASKASGDLLCLSYVRTFGLPISIIRPFNNYGPRQNDGTYAGVIPLTINRLLRGKRPVIFGNGKQTRDYIFVGDTVRAAILLAKKDGLNGEVFNVASGREISILELIREISLLMDYRPIISDHLPERPGDVRRHIANIYKAEDLLDFRPEIDLSAGLLETIAYYREKGKNGKAT